MDKREELLCIFPDYLKNRMTNALHNIRLEALQEIRLAVKQPVRVIGSGLEHFLSETGDLLAVQKILQNFPSDIWYLRAHELEDILKNICQYSIYAFENEIKQGFLTIQGGHRIGLAGKMITDEQGQVRNMSHIRFLNVRVAHEIIGAADSVIPFLYEEGHFLNTLVISSPGGGKTTLLRDLVRQVADGNRAGTGRQVGVVDERSEIAACYLGIPQNHIGLRTDVMDACPKVQGMMLLMRSMSPAVIAVDEIGGSADLQAIEEIVQCGINILATMHGDSIEEVRAHLNGYQENQSRLPLFQRYVFLKKEGEYPGVVEILDADFISVLQRGNIICSG